MSYGIVGPPWWNEVWIVACGPSGKSFNLARANGKTVVPINSAVHREYPESAGHHWFQLAIFSADPDWVRGNRYLLATQLGENHACVALDTHPDLANIPGVTYLQRCHEDGLSDDPAFLCTGGNSGYAAVNLAYLKGAKDIHLVGFDMDPSTDPKFEQWIPRFRTMLPQLQKAGVRVTNHNPHSFIDAFPKEE